MKRYIAHSIIYLWLACKTKVDLCNLKRLTQDTNKLESHRGDTTILFPFPLRYLEV